MQYTVTCTVAKGNSISNWLLPAAATYSVCTTAMAVVGVG